MSYSYKSIPGNPTADQLVEAGDKPDVNYLNFEFKRSLYTGNNVTRVDNNDAVRYCKWSGQTDDGKKWSSQRPDGEQVFPFEGASDVRVRLVDSTINEIVATLTTAFERGSLKVSGVDVGDAAAASTATDLALLPMRLAQTAPITAQGAQPAPTSTRVKVSWAPARAMARPTYSSASER